MLYTTLIAVTHLICLHRRCRRARMPQPHQCGVRLADSARYASYASCPTEADHHPRSPCGCNPRLLDFVLGENVVIAIGTNAGQSTSVMANVSFSFKGLEKRMQYRVLQEPFSASPNSFGVASSFSRSHSVLMKETRSSLNLPKKISIW